MGKIKRDVIQILRSKEFGIKKCVNLSTKIRNLPGWDSLKHLTFLLAIEKKFKISIPPQEIASLISVKDFVHFISKK